MRDGLDPNAAALDALGERYWRHSSSTDFRLRSHLGLPVETIRPVTFEVADRDASVAQGVLDGLRRIDARRLDHDRWLTHRTLSFRSANDVAKRTYFWLEPRVTPYAGGDQLNGIVTVLARFRFDGADDARRYVELLRQYAAVAESLLAVLREQHARAIVLPQVAIDGCAAMFRAYAQPSQTGALVPGDARLAAFSTTARAALRRTAGAIIDSEIVPALLGVAAFLDGPYRAGAPAGVGLGQYPGGCEYYEHLAHAYTTLTVTPEQLHAQGLAEVARLNERLDAVRREAGVAGSLAEFKQFLAHDRRFFVKTMEEFGACLERYVRRAEAGVPQFFSALPAAPYGVAPLAKELAEGQTFGYFEPPGESQPRGIYYYNAWHPERASTLTAGAMICHELVPGHHFQIALQHENEALPNVRRYDFSEAGFCEGWGEYAAELGWDMGVYETPYDRAGRIVQDVMVSARLVVDTGMNVLGWSRERAMAYMREHLTLGQGQIASESLRYSTDIPGHALAYKTGELAILDIRERARERLAGAFDIRQFHAWTIGSGPMTLDTLRAHVDYEAGRAQAR